MSRAGWIGLSVVVTGILIGGSHLTAARPLQPGESWGHFFVFSEGDRMDFRVDTMTQDSPSSATVHGVMGIHGVDHPVVWDVTLSGMEQNHRGVPDELVGTTTIRRADFGLTGQQPLGAGTWLMGEEFTLVLKVRARLRQDPDGGAR